MTSAHPTDAADFAPRDASDVARKLQERHIFIKPLDGPVLGLCYMRVATALPAENARVVAAFKEIL